MVKEIVISSEFEGISPKGFLKKNLNVPYSSIVKLIQEKRITINGKKIKKEQLLRKGDLIKVWKNDLDFIERKKEFVSYKDLGIELIYENDDFLVLNKPSGIVVQGAQEREISISMHLAYLKYKNNDNSDFEYFHAHRLDKDTSGLVVVGKNPSSLRQLNLMFRSREVIKKYLCLCNGFFDKKSGKVEIFMKRNEIDLKEKALICKENEDGARKTLSYYKVLEELEYKNEEFSLVEVEIKTGFTHQIRAHMKYLGHPILMDKIYGNLSINEIFKDELERQFLHSSYLAFKFKEKDYEFSVDLMDDLKVFLSGFKKIK